MESSNLSAALELAAAGLPIFPAGHDKRPLIAGWQEKATTDLDCIQDWWRTYPSALPAIPMGNAGLVAIDCDRHPGRDDGIKAFNQLLAANGGKLSNVPMTKTAGGGAHLFFRQPTGEPLGNGRGELPDGIDVRGTGGFVIAPGAALLDGRRWASVDDKPSLAAAFKNGHIPELPPWLLNILRPGQQPSKNGNDEHARAVFSSLTTDVSRGRAYAAAALDGVVAELRAAPDGKRNEMLNAAAFRMGKMIARGWMSEEAVIGALLGACDANKYLREHGNRATMKTIESGFAAGRKEPHLDLPDRAPQAVDLSRLSDLSDQGGAKQQANGEQLARNRNAETGTWDEPDWALLDDRRGELPEFSVEAMPASSHGWLLRASRGAGVTPAHVAVPLLGIASSLIGTARRVRASRSWSEPLSMWVALIGFSGSGKTPGIDVTRRALSLIERGQKQKIAEMQREHETRVQKATAEKKKWEQAVADAVAGNCRRHLNQQAQLNRVRS